MRTFSIIIRYNEIAPFSEKKKENVAFLKVPYSHQLVTKVGTHPTVHFFLFLIGKCDKLPCIFYNLA